MGGDNDDFFPDHDAAGRDRGGGAISDEYSADFQLPLPPLAEEDVAFLRAVAARAGNAASSRGTGGQPILRSLIAAYNAEASERGMQRGLAPIYQGYLLRMSDGVSVDELVSGSSSSSSKGKPGDKRISQKL